MRITKLTLFVPAIVFLAASAMAQPRVATGGIKNAASFASQGLPNAPIAEGAIFSIFGTNLGPDTAEFGFNYPLPTVTPAGKVSVSVTVGGTTTQAIILYSGKTQINAVLPSSTPVGTGTVTVTVNGQASPSTPIEVVKSNFGTFSVNSAGSAPGIVTFADFSLVTISKAANPGETLILWGTGLGPVSGNEGGSALPGDQPGIPVELYVGSQTAALTYRGRSGCCSGLDQIGFVVPPGVEGCSVPIAVKIGDKVSNFTTFSVARTGRTCSDAATGLNTADYTKIFSQPNVAVGSLSLSRTTSITPGILGTPAGTTVADSGFAGFNRYTFAPGTSFNSATFNSVSIGACTVLTFTDLTASSFPGLTLTGLDAGASIGLSGPSGSRMLTRLQGAGVGLYSTKLGDGTSGNYLDPGSYTFTGPGGADVGAFTAELNLPSSLVWTNQSAVTTVNRAAGQTVTWTGGDPNSFVSIDGANFILSGSSAIGASFHCQAPTSAGTFTVPPVVLLSLPGGGGTSVGGITIPGGSLSVGASSALSSFTALGLDIGFVSAVSSTSKTLAYQ